MATSPVSQLQTPRNPLKSQGEHKTLFTAPSISLYYQTRTKRTVETFGFDQAYLSRLALGDDVTTEHFVHYFYKLLIAKLRAKMRSPDLAEDVAQETLLRVLKHVKTFGGIKDPEKLGGFVNSVAENILLETIRQSGRFQQVPENTPEPMERALDAERSCISEELKQRIRRELKKLKKSDQVLIAKVFLLEQDKDSICADLGIDRNYLRVQVHRALGRFRKVLGASGSNGARKGAAG